MKTECVPRSTLRAVTLLICVGCPALDGCGSDDGPGASCGQVQPCGGDLIGSWNMVALCQDRAKAISEFAMAAMASPCPTQTLRNFSLSISGTYVFNADLTYSASAVLGGAVDVHVPAACLAGASCAALTASLQAAIAAGTAPGLVSASCSGSSDCLCHQVTSLPQVDSGSYTTMGTALNFVSAAGTTMAADYCAKENTVHFTTLAIGSTAIEYDYVGMKQ